MDRDGPMFRQTGYAFRWTQSRICPAFRQPCPKTGQGQAMQVNFNVCFQQLTMVSGLHHSRQP
jgi:hypothetical protein